MLFASIGAAFYLLWGLLHNVAAYQVYCWVVAHQSCNSAKADHLPAIDYLSAWADRNDRCRVQLAEEFGQRGILHDLPTSVRIARWAYQTTFEAGGLTWNRSEGMIGLPRDWQQSLVRFS